MGTADMLPVCLIRKILCYLSYREASRMRILSKTWLLAWLDLPNLEFSGKSIAIVDNIMERYRDGNIPIDKFEFDNSKKPDRISALIDKWLGIALQNGVRHLVYRDVTHSKIYPFPIFKFLEANFLGELVLMGCDLMHVSLSNTSNVVICCSLRKLSLSRVRLDKNMLQTILTSCPFIVDLIIRNCTRLKNVELRNLPKIKSLAIDIDHPIKIEAPTLENLYYSSFCLNKLNIDKYKNLKSLEISCTKISDIYLNRLIFRPYCLEKLVLANISLGRFNVCRSRSLKVLKIHNCRKIGAIYAPNLVLLEYKGHDIPQLKFAQESRQLKQSQMILYPLFNVDAAWFCQLRQSLSDSISWSQVTIYFHKYEEINMNDLQLHCRDAIPKVDVLDVNFLRPTGECSKFVDALLWSCRPRKLNLQSTSEMFTCFMDRLMHMKSLRRSLSHEMGCLMHMKNWRRAIFHERHGQLKEAKVYKFDQRNQSWHPVEHKRGELSIRTVSTLEKYFFLLDW
ncbi:putative F-box/LRR-repeat protein At3g44810 [Solanum stenotomum]|uniref:putative F-box/LRR-repeat protein At3g44810 n=1 Tax=Solanum stenotomum TaxID=172797 RepID=UPI0020D0E730|nr:putative F-box/LRR-repeat protein At3g44810 [Solanum stenotomum]